MTGELPSSQQFSLSHGRGFSAEIIKARLKSQIEKVKEIWNLLRVNSRGRNFFQKAHFLTRCPLRTRETFAFSSRTSLLMGSCRGQYVVDHVPSAERLGFLQKEKKMMRKLFYRVEEKILSLTCLSFHKKNLHTN